VISSLCFNTIITFSRFHFAVASNEDARRMRGSSGATLGANEIVNRPNPWFFVRR
jgi:hypothetical protein